MRKNLYKKLQPGKKDSGTAVFCWWYIFSEPEREQRYTLLSEASASTAVVAVRAAGRRVVIFWFCSFGDCGVQENIIGSGHIHAAASHIVHSTFLAVYRFQLGPHSHGTKERKDKADPKGNGNPLKIRKRLLWQSGRSIRGTGSCLLQEKLALVSINVEGSGKIVIFQIR